MQEIKLDSLFFQLLISEKMVEFHVLLLLGAPGPVFGRMLYTCLRTSSVFVNN